MEREIKFRAYINKSKGIKEISQINYATKTIVTTDGYCYGFKDIILMQYTGLKDKNGKEIYEGDIVEFKDVGEEGYEYKEGFGFDNIAQVVYKNGIYTLSNFGETDNSYYATNSTDEERLEEVLRNRNCKVVGNIYDNPELLEKGE